MARRMPPSTTAAQPLRLLAADLEDIAVIAACVQDAVLTIGDMGYDPKQRRFALVGNRFRWESLPDRDSDANFAGTEGGSAERVRAGLHFNGVSSAQLQGFDQKDVSKVLNLLTVTAETGAEGAATITLVFAEGGLVRLQAECIDAQLSDLGAPWATPNRPFHPLDAEGVE